MSSQYNKISVFFRGLLFFVVVELLVPNKIGAESVAAHQHHIALLVGVSIVDEGSETFSTVGFDYEYKPVLFDKTIGIVTLVDFGLRAAFYTAFASGITAHPFAGLKVLAAPGVEVVKSHAGHDAEVNIFTRFGAAYDFHVNSWTVSPAFNIDLINGSHVAYLPGVSVGIGF